MRQTEWSAVAVHTSWTVAPQENFRLDPAKHRHAIRMELQDSVLVGESALKLEDGLVIEGRLRSGIAARVACKRSAFRGVAARLHLSSDDQVIAELVLLHRDPSLNMPVARSNDMNELAADWQMWAKRFNLPLILIEPDGVEQMLSNRLGALDVAPAYPRRAGRFFAKRRPRFMARRKKGTFDPSNKVIGREIIARH